MEASDLKPIFTNAIKIRGSKNLHAVDDVWKTVENYHDRQSVVTLDLIARSLEYVPAYLSDFGSSFDLIIIAQLMQRLNKCPIRHYVSTVLSTSFGFHEDQAKLAQELADIRHNLQIPDQHPHNLMHDINLTRLAFPFEDFLENQLKRVKAHEGFESTEKFLQTQMRLCRFWLSRGQVFSQKYYRHKYEREALENILRYVDLEDQILDLLCNIPITNGDESEDQLRLFDGTDAGMASRLILG